MKDDTSILRPAVLAAITLTSMLLPFGCSTQPSHDATASRQQALERPTALKIDLSRGSLTIIEGPDITANRISTTVRAFGKDQAEADQRLKNSLLRIRPGVDGETELVPYFPSPEYDNDAIDVTIELKSGGSLALDAESSLGNITITGGSGERKLRSSTGNVRVTGSEGSLTIRTSTGDVLVENHTGAMDVDCSTGDITINEHSNGAIKADCSTGSIQITLSDRATGPIIADSSTGDIKISLGMAFTGRVDIEAGLGHILVEDESGRAVLEKIDDGEERLLIKESTPISSLGSSLGNVLVTLRPEKKDDPTTDAP